MTALLGSAVQCAYIVNDLAEAMRRWADVFGIGPFVYVDDVALAEARFRGRPCHPRLNVALSYVGETQIELIQQTNDAPSPYSEFLAAGREGIQHLGYWPDDIAAACHHLEARGLSRVYEVRPAGQENFTVYYDDPGGLGVMTELIRPTPAKQKIYAALKALARDWDGREPARRVPDFGAVLS
jgi:catechol 2,3-dioxygenase-like lactoylglutathione lyase family enzyme